MAKDSPEFSSSFFSLKRLSLLSSSIGILLIANRNSILASAENNKVEILAAKIDASNVDLFLWCLLLASTYYAASFFVTAYIERAKILDSMYADYSAAIEGLSRSLSELSARLSGNRSAIEHADNEIIHTFKQHTERMSLISRDVASTLSQLPTRHSEFETRDQIVKAIALSILKGVEQKSAGGLLSSFPKIEADEIYAQFGEAALNNAIARPNGAFERFERDIESIVQGALSALEMRTAAIASVKTDLSQQYAEFEHAVGASAIKKLTDTFSAQLNAVRIRFWFLDVLTPSLLYLVLLVHFWGLFARAFPAFWEILPKF